MQRIRRPSPTRASRRPKRRGIPLTVYLSPELSEAVAATSRDRRVDKATIVRAALERLLEQLANGQMTLPLGL